ncbi:MAG: 2OG-Fe(II) oxygenase [Verrucomicrobia bacterium]|jgi:hypothetical protein|nr:2OG-Fe(II) oxygenase [Verrucomicrobiota bacterium]
MLQLSLNGLREGSKLEQEEIRQEFALRHCVFLKGFLSPALLGRIKGLIKNQEYYTRIDRDREGKVFAREVTLKGSDPLANLMFLLLNQKDLFDLIENVTVLEKPMQYFRSRVYEFHPNPDHYDSWHDDDEKGQTIGLSINLSPDPMEGGEFEIRSTSTQEVYKKVSGSCFGDAHIFRIGPEYEHRVLPVRGTNPRRSCAGWFCTQPDYRVEIKKMLMDPKPSHDGDVSKS